MPMDPILESLGARWPAEESTFAASELGTDSGRFSDDAQGNGENRWVFSGECRICRCHARVWGG